MEGKGGGGNFCGDIFAEGISWNKRRVRKRNVGIYTYICRFCLPSGLVEVPEILEEILPLLLVRYGILVEDLGHVRGYECARVRAC